MVVLEVRLNGKLLTTAGRDDLCVLNAIVDAVGVLGPASPGTKTQEQDFVLSLHVGGLAAGSHDEAGTHLRWVPRRELGVGDEVSVRILTAAIADQSQAETPRAPPSDEEERNTGRLRGTST